MWPTYLHGNIQNLVQLKQVMNAGLKFRRLNNIYQVPKKDKPKIMYLFIKKISAVTSNKLEYTHIYMYLLAQNFSWIVQPENLC